MKHYKVWVSWSVIAYKEIEAENDRDMANQLDEMGLHRFDPSYLEDSFKIDEFEVHEDGDSYHYDGPPEFESDDAVNAS